MRLAEIRMKVEAATAKLIANDSVLLDNDTHEISISSKLGAYLRELTTNADCEYNRHILDVKTLYGYKKIRPDILIHQRLTDANNLLVIEIKKHDKPDDDLETLTAMTVKGGEYGYDFGLFLAFEKRDNKWFPLLRWFENGAEIA